VQVDPMQPKMKAPGAKRLTPKCDEPLSSFAFKFMSRRFGRVSRRVLAVLLKVGRCSLTL